MHRITFAFVALALASIASAQPLLDRVPADAIVYIGWRGTDSLGATYDNSHLAAVVKASKLSDIVDQTVPQIFAKIAQDKPEAAAMQQAILPLLKHALKRPTVLYISPRIDARGGFVPSVGILCDAGDSAADFHKGLVGVIEQAGKDAGMKTARDGNVVIITFTDNDPLAALKPQSVLRDAPAFTSAVKQVDADAVCTAYFNVEQLLSAMDRDNQRGKRMSLVEMRATRDALGLSGLKRVVMTGAFAGKDWSSRIFIDAPAPRKGLVALLTEQPVSESTLKLVPKTASYAMVHQFDPGKIMSAIRDAGAAADPKAGVEFDKQLAKASTQFGTDIRRLINSFGDQWAMYNDANVGGEGNAGIIIAHVLRDPAIAEAGLSTAFTEMARVTRQRQGRPGGPAGEIVAGETTVGDIKMHTVTAQNRTMFWLVKNGKLYVAFTPQAAAAATLVGTPRVAPGTVFDNAKFAALRQQLAAPTVTGFTFADLPTTAEQAHGNIQAGIAVIGMLASGQGIWVPPNLLPPLDVLKQHLSPAGSVSWVDATGWHSRGKSPFPGSGMFASQQVGPMAVGGGALGASILLPSLNRARETANRVKCASNMRQIGQAILLYSNDNKGKYPNNLGELLKTQDITIEVFTCPSGDIEAPTDIAATDIPKLAAWLDAGKSPYIYVGKGMRNNSPADALVLYEREDDHDEDGMNMLFGDGHVEWNSMEQAKKIIAANELKK